MIVKPDACAYKGCLQRVTPDASGKGLAGILMGSEKWKDALVNDFERAFFPNTLGCARLKHPVRGGGFLCKHERSGSAVYGLFDGVRQGKFKGMSYWSGTL